MTRRIVRALLRLLPLDFRSDYGREMERVFREERDGARHGAPRSELLEQDARGLVART